MTNLSIDKLSIFLQHGFIKSVENVILTNIINTADGTSIVVVMCCRWNCHADDMADGQTMYADDIT